MKRLSFLLIICFAVLTTACKKEEQTPDCLSCVFVIANGEGYAYKVKLSGGINQSFTLKAGELKNVTVKTGVSVKVDWDFQSPFAHSDFSGTYQCPGDCGAVSVVLKE